MVSLAVLDLLLGLVVSVGVVSVGAHPHHPKAFVLSGAKARATLTYLTVPYNPEAVATLAPGADWHLGFAQLTSEMDMTSGTVKIPAGSYRLNVRRGQDGGFVQAVLKPREGDPIVLPIEAYDAPDDEHLTLRVVNEGYVAAGRGSTEPAGGAAFTIMMSFGNLHRKLALNEVF